MFWKFYLWKIKPYIEHTMCLSPDSHIKINRPQADFFFFFFFKGNPFRWALLASQHWPTEDSQATLRLSLRKFKLQSLRYRSGTDKGIYNNKDFSDMLILNLCKHKNLLFYFKKQKKKMFEDTKDVLHLQCTVSCSFYHKKIYVPWSQRCIAFYRCCCSQGEQNGKWFSTSIKER